MRHSFPYTIRFIQFETRRREAHERILLAEIRRATRRRRKVRARAGRA